MEKNHVIFVCEHGAAKSVIAAAYFNKLAEAKSLQIHAIARGTNPDDELSTKTVNGLSADGISPTEATPRKLSPSDLEHAERIVTFCELPEEYRNRLPIEDWSDIPPVSESYEKARDAILEKLNGLIESH